MKNIFNEIVKYFKNIQPDLFNSNNCKYKKNTLVLPNVIVDFDPKTEGYTCFIALTVSRDYGMYVVKLLTEIFIINKEDYIIGGVYYIDKEGKLHTNDEAEKIFVFEMNMIKEQFDVEFISLFKNNKNMPQA